MEFDLAGGILGALGVLKDHWGAVERDLAAAHWSMAEFLEQLPFSAFISFIMHSPPTSAVFHEKHKGWTVNDHLQAQSIDALNLLVWSKTVDAQEKNPKHRPKPIPRPGMEAVVEEKRKSMTVGEYQKRLEERRGK